MNELPEKLGFEDGFLVRIYMSGSLPIKGIMDRTDGEEIIRRYNGYADLRTKIDALADALQGAIVALYEIERRVNPILVIAKLKPFPMPPMDGMKKALQDAGFPVYESAKEVQTAIAQNSSFRSP